MASVDGDDHLRRRRRKAARREDRHVREGTPGELLQQWQPPCPLRPDETKPQIQNWDVTTGARRWTDDDPLLVGFATLTDDKLLVVRQVPAARRSGGCRCTPTAPTPGLRSGRVTRWSPWSRGNGGRGARPDLRPVGRPQAPTSRRLDLPVKQYGTAFVFSGDQKSLRRGQVRRPDLPRQRSLRGCVHIDLDRDRPGGRRQSARSSHRDQFRRNPRGARHGGRDPADPGPGNGSQGVALRRSRASAGPGAVRHLVYTRTAPWSCPPTVPSCCRGPRSPSTDSASTMTRAV